MFNDADFIIYKYPKHLNDMLDQEYSKVKISISCLHCMQFRMLFSFLFFFYPNQCSIFQLIMIYL